MTDPAEDSKNIEESDDANGCEEPELRTDGGEVTAQNSAFAITGGPGGPTQPPEPEAPPRGAQRTQGETQTSLPEAKHATGNQLGDLPDSVETHFTPAELQRLRRIAESKNAQSAWVIKRLFRDPEE